MFFSKRNLIIKKAVKKTVSDFADRTPKIYEHFFYGAFDIAPQYLVVWYLFQTDAELETAKSSGYCDDLEKATISNLIDLGYPQEAFENEMAKQYAYNYQLIPFAGSDIHGKEAHGERAGMCCKTPVLNENDFVQKVLAGEMTPFQNCIEPFRR